MEGTLAGIHLPQSHGSEGDPKLRTAWWGVVAVFLVHGLIVSTWVSRIAAVKIGLNLSDAALGIALLGAAMGSIAAIPLSGWAIGRYGSRAVVLCSGVGFALSLVLLGASFSLVTLTAALVYYGAMAGANDVAINAHAVEVEKRLGRPTMSRFHAMFSLGGIVGAALGGWIASKGTLPLPHFLAAAVVILSLILVARRLTRGAGRRLPPGSADESHEKSGFLFRRPPFALLALSLIGFCIFLSEGAVADWTAVYLRQVLGAGEGTAAAGYAFFSATMTVFRFTGDAITVRLGRAWTIRGGAIIAAFGLALVAAANSPAMALAGFGITGVGFSSIVPLVFAAGGRIPSVSEGAGVATVSGIGYLGFIVGPPAIGFISEASSLRGGIFLLVVLCALSAALVSAVERSAAREGSNPLA